MTPLVPLVTAFAVLLHALLGCCLHHAHAGVNETGADAAAIHDGQDCSDAPAIANAASGHGSEHGGANQPLAISHPDHANDHEHDQPRQCQESDCSLVLTVPAAFAVGVDAHWTYVDDQAAAEITVRLSQAKRSPTRGEESSPARRLSRLCIWLI